MAKAKQIGRPTIFRTAMSERVRVRLDDAQAHAISAWCRKHGCSVISMFRESSLQASGASSLGKTIAGIGGHQNGRGLSGSTTLPVPFTVQQMAALRKYAAKRKIALVDLIRESALKIAGSQHLGHAARDARKIAEAVGSG